MRITQTLDIDEAELEERFVRSSGPGGQNVNKVSTAVELRFDLAANRSIPDFARGKLKRLAGRRLTTEGIIVIQADRFRSQEQNRSDARERLKELVMESLSGPSHASRPSRRVAPENDASTPRRRAARSRRCAAARSRWTELSWLRLRNCYAAWFACCVVSCTVLANSSRA